MKKNPKETGVLFTGENLALVKNRRKIQTRRVMIPQPKFSGPDRNFTKLVPGFLGYWGEWRLDQFVCMIGDMPKPPHGGPGDLLWLKERWAASPWYDKRKPSEIPVGRRIYMGREIKSGTHRIRSPRFMCKWMTRNWLTVVDVWAEKLLEITEEDAKKEGIFLPNAHSMFTISLGSSVAGRTASEAYLQLWDQINEKRGWGSYENPWTWVTEFKRIRRRSS